MRTKIMTVALLGLATLLLARGPSRAQEAKPAKTTEEAPEGAAGRLAEAMEKDPVLRPKATYQFRLFLMDIARGKATVIVDEPGQGLTYCGSPSWSRDGRRLLFDCTPLTLWALSHLMAIDLADGPPKLTDLGAGNCPSPSPDGKRIAFLSNEEGSETGVYTMNADGTGRTRFVAYGRPKWSPDGRQILVSGFGDPCSLSVVDVESERVRPVQIAGRQIFSIPTWADAKTIIVTLGAEVADSIALIDVSDPENPKVKEALWKKGDGPDVTPADPVYHAATRRCIFVGVEPKGMALYTFEVGKPGPPKRLEPEGFDPHMGDLALSPDGRFVVFHSDQFARPPR